MTQLIVRRRAPKQIAAVEEWWRANRHKNPHLFTAELAHALSLIAEAPGAGLLVPWSGPNPVRRFLMSATRYHIYYYHDPRADRLIVLAIWGAQRRNAPREQRGPSK